MILLPLTIIVIHQMQGNADFDEVNTCLGFKVTRKANHAAQTNSNYPQAYIGVCPANDCLSVVWSIQVQTYGVPQECIAWGMEDNALVLDSMESKETHQLHGRSYAPDTTVILQVKDGVVTFYEEVEGTQRLVASVHFTNATLRPFVAVRGHDFQFTVTAAKISGGDTGNRPHSLKCFHTTFRCE
jgi:hypothetical protein